MSLLELSVDPVMRKFLFDLQNNKGAASRTQLPPADRGEDQARQKCRRRGYVEYKGGLWYLTEAGRAAVARLA